MSAIETTVTASAPNRPVYGRAELESIFLPVKQMLQIDRVAEINGDHVVCEMDVPGHWAFAMHFPSDPVFPGTLLIEAAGQAVAIWAWHAGLRGRPRLVKVWAKFESPVLPQDRVVRLVAAVRQRKSICTGTVGLFVSEREVAQIRPTIVVLSQPTLGLEGHDSSFDSPVI